jgi:cobalamin biosynthesis Mg chelatase CobN
MALGTERQARAQAGNFDFDDTQSIAQEVSRQQPSTGTTSSSSNDKQADAPALLSGNAASEPASSNSHPLFDPNSPESRAEEQANRQSERDNLFVKYLLISCAAAGVIIALVVWRSMPPKPKANT